MEFLEPLLNWRVVDGLDNKKLGKTLLILLRLLLRLPFNMRHLLGGGQSGGGSQGIPLCKSCMHISPWWRASFHDGGAQDFRILYTSCFYQQALYKCCMQCPTQRPA